MENVPLNFWNFVSYIGAFFPPILFLSVLVVTYNTARQTLKKVEELEKAEKPVKETVARAARFFLVTGILLLVFVLWLIIVLPRRVAFFNALIGLWNFFWVSLLSIDDLKLPLLESLTWLAMYII